MDGLPENAQSSTAAFFAYQSGAFFAYSSSISVGVSCSRSGPNLDTVTTNSQKFLQGKWSRLSHVACTLQGRSPPGGVPSPSSNEERQHHPMVRQLVRSGSPSAAYQRLTQLGLYPADPRPRFLEIHRDDNLTSMHLHPDIAECARQHRLGRSCLS